MKICPLAAKKHQTIPCPKYVYPQKIGKRRVRELIWEMGIIFLVQPYNFVHWISRGDFFFKSKNSIFSLLGHLLKIFSVSICFFFTSSRAPLAHIIQQILCCYSWKIIVRHLHWPRIFGWLRKKGKIKGDYGRGWRMGRKVEIPPKMRSSDVDLKDFSSVMFVPGCMKKSISASPSVMVIFYICIFTDRHTRKLIFK